MFKLPRIFKFKQDSMWSLPSMVLFLLIFSCFVSIIGLIYIYGNFSERKGRQIADFVQIERIPSEKDIPTPQQAVPQVAAVPPKPVPTADSKPAVPQQPATTKGALFFVHDTDAQALKLKAFPITIPENSAPLTYTINALLKGPTAVLEQPLGFFSLIPKEARLLSARIENHIAYLNFSEEFRFNPSGTDGYYTQLQQVVYTATSFPSVQSVQILIEGGKVDYLHEGIYVGQALSRDSFS